MSGLIAYPVVEFFMEGFGSWAKQKRNARRWTLEYLGELVGTTPAAISRYESGARQANRDTILLIADALAGPEADEDERESLRREALAASVGIEMDSQEPRHPYSETALEVAANYDQLPLELQPTFLAMIKAATAEAKARRTDIVGKKADDGEGAGGEGQGEGKEKKG